MPQARTGFLPMAIGLMIILLAIAADQFSRYSLSPDSSNQSATSTDSSTTAFVVPSDWKTYQDNQYHFSIQYPSDFSITEEPGLSVSLVPPLEKYFDTSQVKEGNITLPYPSEKCDVNYPYLGPTSTVGLFTKNPHSEGAAGSIYTGSDYTLEKDGLCYSIKFYLRIPNNGESTTFPGKMSTVDFMSLVDNIVSTFKFIK